MPEWNIARNTIINRLYVCFMVSLQCLFVVHSDQASNYPVRAAVSVFSLASIAMPVA